MSIAPETEPSEQRQAAALRAAKADMRRTLLARRTAIGAADQSQAAAALAERSSQLNIKPGQVVAGYHPIRDEIDPRPLMQKLFENDTDLALPAVETNPDGLVFRRYRPGDALVAGRFSTREPMPDAAVVRPDIVLVPLLGFDRHGGRLGYGKGYYDRALAMLERTARIRAIGIAHAAQEVDAVPTEAHDRPLDAVLTDRALITPARGDVG